MWCNKSVPFELKSSEPDGSQFTGIACCYNNIDAWQHILQPGCFKDSLNDFLTVDGFIGGMNHNWSDPIGKPLAVNDGPTGLLLTGSVVETEHGKDVRILLKEGIVRKLSIGFYINDWEYLETQTDVEDYWKSCGYTPNDSDKRMMKYGALLIRKGTLKETSPVMFPANDRADIVSVKSIQGTPTIEQSADLFRLLQDKLNLMSKADGLREELRCKFTPLLLAARETIDAILTKEDVTDQAEAERMQRLLSAMRQEAAVQELLAGVSL